MLKFLVRIRVLPVAIFAAGLILTAKIGDVADLMGAGTPRLEVAKVQAQQGPTQLQPPPAQQAPYPPTQQQQAPGQQPQAQASAPASQPPASPSEPVQATSDASDPANDPTLLSQSEIDILQQLAERREELERQEQEIVQRQALLAAAEQRIDRKVQELKNLQAAIDALLKKHNEQEEQQLRSLVRLYENMKPKDAGRIFEEMDYETLLLVADRMNERKLAPIMAVMDPAKAKEVTVRLATQRKLPNAANAANVKG